jgi:hypothetical protein
MSIIQARDHALVWQHVVVTSEGIWQYHSYATWRALLDTDISNSVYTNGVVDPWLKSTYPLNHLQK